MASLGISYDMVLGSLMPVVVYWVYGGMYMALGSCDNYRLHPKEDEDEKNFASKETVIKGVLWQQFRQFIATNLLYMMTGGSHAGASSGQPPSLTVIARQFVVAMLVFDTYQYFLHRYLHHNKFLYRHLHSKHHRLVVPYPFGAIYSHPIEGFLFDILGGSLAIFLSGMSPRTSAFFSSFAAMKSVDDHCGLMLPGNPFHIFFENNTAYHDLHHQLYGGKYNFSQPFFAMWDRILGTHMPYSLEKGEEGGFELRPAKECKND
ncbi:sphinganine C4-monooxygenase 2-like [Herrania umbratica]|uniref:Sphinganine C4-monooxygenase 2-like n=1 Tax=Herrania umbratica TaxID=108875 RepID=A0A6J1BKS3_9ROSI|nr:sphinganine C4-monooxygenase 2-like [Herrania umbratica]